MKRVRDVISLCCLDSNSYYLKLGVPIFNVYNFCLFLFKFSLHAVVSGLQSSHL